MEVLAPGLPNFPQESANADIAECVYGYTASVLLSLRLCLTALVEPETSLNVTQNKTVPSVPRFPDRGSPRLDLLRDLR
jgi:hypothetical protein